MLWDLREKFLLLKENSEVTGSQKAFESSTRVHSNAFITPYVDSTETYFPELLENKNNLKKVIETKEDDFAKRYKIELGAYKKYYVMTKEMLEDYKRNIIIDSRN
jgi:hypothetical protein